MDLIAYSEPVGKTFFARGIRAPGTIVLALACIVASLSFATAAAAPASAALASNFNPGNIISDSVFFNPAAMSEAAVQSFMQSVGPPCRSGYTCLENYTQTTTSRAADSRCGGYYGMPNERASTILWKVAQSCGINPQVLLVLIQKEENLVLSSAPTTGMYKIAAGYGCPDTAACDTTFYGFFNQLYSAARQFQVYANSASSFGYRAGRNNYIQWSPDAGCGGSNVYIVNKATAGLYNYTPYQPDPPALANLYGYGDGCSSYGNRNFFTYFTDWFGNTQGSFLARTASDATVYLTTDTAKFGVPTGDLLANFSALGPVRTISQSYLDTLAAGTALSSIVRDSVSGEIFIVTANNKYRFASCDLVAAYGFSCATVANLQTPQLSKLPTVGNASQFVRVPGIDTVYYLSNGQKLPINDPVSFSALTGNQPVSITPIQWWVAANIPTGPTILGPGTLAKTATSTSVYLIDGANKKFFVPTSDMITSIGATSVNVVSQATLDGYTTSGTISSPAVTCGGSPALLQAGQLLGTTRTDGYGLPITALDPRTCADWPSAGPTFAANVFVRGPNGTIYQVSGAIKRPIVSMASFQSLAGQGNVPRYVSLPDSLLATWSTGPSIIGNATLVKAAESPTVFLVDGVGKKSVQTFDSVYDLGVQKVVDVLPQSLLATLPTSGTVQDSPMVSCGASNFVGGGALFATTRTDGYGQPITALDPSTCSALPMAGGRFGDVLFTRDSAGTISWVSSGVRRPVANWNSLVVLSGAGNPVSYAQLPDRYIARYRAGPPILGPGTLVKTPDANQVFMIDGLAHAIPLGTYDIALDMNASLSTDSVSTSVLASYPSSGSLTSPAITCGAQQYIAASGALIPWTNETNGLPQVVLDPMTCASAPKAAAQSGRLFARSTDVDTVYYIDGGQRHAISSWAALVALAGTNTPTIVFWRPGTMAPIPVGAPA